MRDDLDHYEIHYADRLWSLLPEVYRASDAPDAETVGPLRELCDRVGAQMAIVRRSIDRTWEDQSIESCDGWAVPYIADLLATNLIANTDLPGQRREVAKTIYYRRRTGTVALLEELANDVTGWDVRVVELFRRLARTPHGIDPEIGLPSATDDPAGNARLQVAAGLAGAVSKTPRGGTASLRSVHGASRCGGAFDEFFYTADVRRGAGRTGRMNIPKLGFFFWRLYSFPEAATDPGALLTTPVPVFLCNGFYSFDPTGRDVPLFSAGEGRFGARWVPAEEWQLPGPIALPLLDQDRAPGAVPHLYSVAEPGGSVTLNSLGVFDATLDKLRPLDEVRIWPEVGRFAIPVPAPTTLRTWHHYGFPGRIGAGAYDRRPFAEPFPTPGAAVTVQGGGVLPSIPPVATVTFTDSLTYDGVGAIVPVTDLTIRSANGCRPLLRPSGGVSWTFEGAPGSKLRFEGMFTTNVDIVLLGEFDEVSVACSTFDPGEADPSGTGWASAVDGRPLAPSRLVIEADVRAITIDRSITGPILTRGGGSVEELTIRDSIVQFPTANRLVPVSRTDVDRCAIALDAGDVSLVRSTVLGPVAVHHLDVSESILSDLAWVVDPQQGCVRFSAWATGSTLPRKYESVRISPDAELFTSRRFGQPGFAQLRATADEAIEAAGDDRGSVREGAANGSEMGVFSSEAAAIKERRLRIKLDEFMPLGLVPVLVHVT